MTEHCVTDIPEVVYHATYRHLLDSILEHGLGHPDHRPQSMWNDSDASKVYLAENIDVALSFAETAEQAEDDWLDNVVVICIRTDKLDLSKISLDPNIQDNTGDYFIYDGVIQRDAMKRVLDDNKRVIYPDLRATPYCHVFKS